MSDRYTSDNVLYSHWVDTLDIEWPYKNFTRKELACKKTGEFYLERRSIEGLQNCRKKVGRPLYLGSAHRSWLHNLAIGGAPRSQHLKIAFDISLRNFKGAWLFLYQALKSCGFTGFGFYSTFIHVDMGKGRMWFGSDSAYQAWAPILSGPQLDVAL